MTSEYHTTQNQQSEKSMDCLKSTSSETSSSAASQVSNDNSTFATSNDAYGYYMMKVVYYLLRGEGTEKE